jgi:hypothetical protein
MDEPLQMIEIGVEISNPAITGNSVTQAKLSLGNGDSRQEFISSGNDTLTGMVRHAPEGPRHRPTDLPVNVRSHGAHRAWFYFRVDPELDLVRSAALLTLVDVRQGSYNLEIDLSACGQ